MFHFAAVAFLVPAVVVTGQLLCEAARLSGHTHKELAICQGISPSVWTRQCQGVAGHHPSLRRIVELCPRAYIAALLGLIAQAHELELQQVFRLGGRS